MGGGEISVDLSQKGGATQKRLGTTGLAYTIGFPQQLLVVHRTPEFKMGNQQPINLIKVQNN